MYLLYLRKIYVYEILEKQPYYKTILDFIILTSQTPFYLNTVYFECISRSFCIKGTYN